MKYLAQGQVTEYTPLTPLPDLRTNQTGSRYLLPGYIPNLFNLVIGLAIVIAVGWIIFGGVEYMTTDSWMGKEEGRKKIKNAIIGLLIIICSYLILNTINPRILTLDLSLEPTRTTAPAGAGGGSGGSAAGHPMTPEEIAESNAMRATLQAQSIATNADPCTQGQTSRCTNLNDLSTTVTNGLTAITSTIPGCTPTSPCITITGGTEGGHSTHSAHNNGTAVDLVGSAAVNAAITNNFSNDPAHCRPAGGGTCSGLVACNVYSGAPGGGRFLYEPIGSMCGGSVPSSGTHWHVSY